MQQTQTVGTRERDDIAVELRDRCSAAERREVLLEAPGVQASSLSR